MYVNGDSMNPAVDEFMLVLRFLLQEWGEENIMILVPETWHYYELNIGVPIHFATDETVTILVDCPDHYIQYHMPAFNLVL